MAEAVNDVRTPASIPSDVFDRSIDDLWRASKRSTVAVVIGLFPFVFIIDERVELAFSPVLPSLLALIVLAIGLPFLLMEGGTRIVSKRRDMRRRAFKAMQSSNVLLGVAITWFVLWMSLGA